MIEFIAPLALGAVALIPQKEFSDRKKITQVFRNIKFNIRGEGKTLDPKYLKKAQNLEYTRYDYRLPYGLVQTDTLTEILASSLRKPVEVKGEQIISVYVYNRKAPTKWFYADLPDPSKTDEWLAPIGHSHKGLIYHDFDKTPHMTVAGTTRFGKTVFLKSTFTYLIEQHPEDVEFFVIDLKGGLEFERYRTLRQVVDVASDASEAARMLEDLLFDIQQTMVEFKSKYITNIVDSTERKRRFIIVDEGAQLAPEKSMSAERKKQLGFCQQALSEITRVAGALGYRLIFCTQYPTADTLPRQIKQNSDAKLSFRLPSDYASEVAIDEYGAEKLERPGQAIYKTHERITVQVPLLNDDIMWRRLEKYERVVERAPEGKAEDTGSVDTVEIG